MKVSLSALQAALDSTGAPRTSAPKAQSAAAASRRAPAADRAEAHRAKGNEWFALGAFAEAAECYTAALNAVPGEARALSNRSACHAALGRYEPALADAEAAVAAQPSFAKAHSRRGLALWHLNRFHESAEAYQTAVGLDSDNADAQAGLHRALKSGGDARRAAAEREAQKQRKLQAEPVQVPQAELDAAAQAAAAAAASARLARYEQELRQHELVVSRNSRARREAVQAWQRSTGTDMQKPEIDRDRSIRVDIFGRLRGACKRSGCKMWRRDVCTAANWSDTRVLKCEDCGEGNDAHDDCGAYEIEDPAPPVDRNMAEGPIKGVHDGRSG